MSWLGIIVGVLRRPRLWSVAVRQMRRTMAPGWWRRSPFLPVPAGDYLHFRLVTQNGGTGGKPSAHDVVSYLDWCRQLRRASIGS